MSSVAPKTSSRLLALLLVGVGLALLAGCSGGKKVSGSSLQGELPDSEVEDFAITETDSGRAQWTLFAKEASTFQSRDLVKARTVRILFFDEKGVKSSELVAREGELFQRTDRKSVV